MTTRRRKARRRASDRGSLLIELMVAFPIFCGLWLLAIYVFGFHVTAVANQRSLRECAWFYAQSSCQRLPPGCPAPSRARVPDVELRAAAEGGFETVAGKLPFLGGSLSSLHGDSFELRRRRSVARPVQLGGAVAVSGRYETMCNTRPEPWRAPIVFELTCRLIGAFCP